MGHLVVVKGYCSGMRLVPLFARLTLGFSPITESLHGTESGGHLARLTRGLRHKKAFVIILSIFTSLVFAARASLCFSRESKKSLETNRK